MKLIVENMGWDDKRYKSLQQNLIPYVQKISKLLSLKNNIMVNLYPNKDKEDDMRAQYDEGVIILYERTPDWRGDFTHELSHQLLPIENYSITLKAKLNKLKRRLTRSKGDRRIFIQDHTYSSIEEIFATLFKWYIIGKVSNNAWLETLNNFVPEGKAIVEKALQSEKLVKSKEEIAREIQDNLIKSVSDEQKDKAMIKEANKVIRKKIKKFGLEKSQEELYVDIVLNEVLNRKIKGRTADVRSILKGICPEGRIDILGLANPIGIFDEELFTKAVLEGFDSPNGTSLRFNVGVNEAIKQKIFEQRKQPDLIKNDPVQETTDYNGIKVDIEWPAGSVRHWPGCPYKNPMVKTAYGYIRHTGSEDGEEVDVYLRENPIKSAKVYRLSQLDKKGNFDEHKFGLGFKTEKEFRTAYCKAMPKKMCGTIDQMTMDKFKKEILKMYKKVKSGSK